MNNVVKSETLFAPVVRGKNALCFESACILIVGAHNSGKKSLQLALKAVMHEIYTWLGKFNAYDFKGLKDKLHFSIGSSTEECLRSMKKELPNFNKLDKIKVVVFYLYDICDKKSYDYILGLTGGFQEACEKNGYNADISNYVIGNKIDLEYWRQVKVSAGLELSKKVSSSTSKAATSAFIIAIDDGGAKFDTSVYDYFEISAFTGQHIDYLSDIIMRTMLSKDVLKRIRATVRYALSSGSDTERSVSESGRGIPTADMLLRKKKNVSSVSEPPADADDDAFMSELKALDEALDEVGASVKREIKSQNELLSDIGGSTDQTDNFASYDRLKRNARVKGQRGGILQLSGSLDGSRGRGELVRARQRSQAQPREPPRAWDHAPAAQPLQREMMLEPTHPDYPIAPSGGGPGIPLPPPPPAPAPVAGAPRAVDGFNFADAENELNMELAELKVSLKIDSKGMEAMQKETDLEEAGEDDKWELDELENAISEGEEESSDDEEKLVPVPALKTTKKKFMPTEEQKSQETQPIVKTIIEPVIVISEKFERIAADSDRLSLEAAQYKKKSSGLVSVKVLCCCCCIIISRCMQQVYSSSVSACVTVGNWCKSFVPKKGLFDNVLADTENAFQTLAKCLKYLTDTTSLLKHPEQWNDLLLLCVAPLVYIMDTTLEVFYIGLSYVVVILSTVALILPSFFTLLIVRTNVVEKESKAFGVRQEVIRHEKKEESLVRWIRIILRSLPMAFYLLVIPYGLVFYVFNPNPTDRYWINTYLIIYLCGIIALQVLGSARAYYSYQTMKEESPNKPPAMYETVAIKETTSYCCFSQRNKDSTVKTMSKKTNPPSSPNSFNIWLPSNIIELLSLALEFCQMSTFAMQNSPFASNDSVSSGVDMLPTSMPTMAPSFDSGVATVSTDTDEFWGSSLFNAVYINFDIGGNATLYMMWAAVGLVWCLILLFVTQFHSELTLYGNLMANIGDKDKAKDSFFFSFTGAIVYGHGKPNNISARMRFIVSILSDALFLIISLQLLQVVACDYPDDDVMDATLRADDSIVCWKGQHAVLAVASLCSYAFYVPLSIMITPMLLEAPPEESGSGDGSGGATSYSKLYMMSVNVVKSIMLLVGVLGPQSISTVVLASTIASCALGVLTMGWFRAQSSETKLKSQYSAVLEPCNVAFINYWKAATYTAAVGTAIAIVCVQEFNNDDNKPLTEDILTYILIGTWSAIVLIYICLWYNYSKENAARFDTVDKLIQYPFGWRDYLNEHPDDFPVNTVSTPMANIENDLNLKSNSDIDTFKRYLSHRSLWWSHGGMEGDTKQENTNLNAESVPTQQVSLPSTSPLTHIPGFTVSPWHDEYVNNSKQKAYLPLGEDASVEVCGADTLTCDVLHMLKTIN